MQTVSNRPAHTRIAPQTSSQEEKMSTRNFVDSDTKQLLTRVRREIHQNPELSNHEHTTAQLIARELRDIGVDGIAEHVAGTGVVAWIRGAEDGPAIMLRADIDALPIQETDNGQPYISRNPGVHHGCGHDGHVAILLGAAKMLHSLRSRMSGSAVLVFQPAEERGGGARRMLEANPWPDDLTPQTSLALHITNDLEVGTVDVRSGPVTAAAQSFDVRFLSSGGHAAQPQAVADPVVASAEFVLSAQTIISRSLSSRSNVVLGLSCIHGGDTRSAIPTEVTIEGTIRAYSDDDLTVVRSRLKDVAAGIAQIHGCDVELDLKDDMYPVSVNDATITDVVSHVGQSVLGESNVTADVVESGADDMAEFLIAFPGCYFRLGAGNTEKGLTSPHHSPYFDFDESAMDVGVEVFVESVLQLQNAQSH